LTNESGHSEAKQTVAAEFAWARDLSLGGLFIALGIVVPIAFHAAGGGHMGRTFLPMYLPVLAGAMLVSPLTAFWVGLITPALSSLFTGMPPVLPTMPMMMIELSLMGLIGSLLHRRLGMHVMLTTLVTLLCGRVVTGLSVLAALSLLPQEILDSAPAFLKGPIPYVAAATLTAIPGLIMLVVLVPAVVMAVEKMSLTRTAGLGPPPSPRLRGTGRTAD